jgi:hypothetical protein
VVFPKLLAGIIIVLTLAMIQGCVVTRGTIGEPLQEDAISAIKKGTTTMAEVVSLIGAPDRIVRGNDREIMDIKSDNLYVFFNRNGIVEEVVYGKRTGRTQFRLWPFGD